MYSKGVAGLVIAPGTAQNNPTRGGDPEEDETEEDEEDVKEEYFEETNGERYYRTPSPDSPSPSSSSNRFPAQLKGNISVHDNGGHDNSIYDNANDQSNKCESV